MNLSIIFFTIIRLILIIRIMLQVGALLETLELQDSAKRKGHFALYNCLVLGHTKYSGVQRVYCISCKTVSWKSSHGFRDDLAAGHRQWRLRCVPGNFLVCSGSTPVLSICCD